MTEEELTPTEVRPDQPSGSLSSSFFLVLLGLVGDSHSGGRVTPRPVRMYSGWNGPGRGAL